MKITHWLAAVCVLTPAMSALAAEKPKVTVSFVFEASMYVNDKDLGDSGRKEVAAAAVKTFLASARDTAFYPFIEWMTGDPEPSNGVTVTVTSKAGLRDQEVNLEYRCRIGDKNRGPLLIVPLYSELDGKFTSEKTTLTTHITAAIKDSMEQLRNTVILEVPIAVDVDLDKQFSKVIVPFPACLLNADADRVFLDVHFTPKGKAQAEKMRLREPAELGSNSLSCRIEKLRYLDLNLDRTNDWSPRLPKVFSHQTVSISKVTVVDYHYRQFVSTLQNDGDSPCD